MSIPKPLAPARPVQAITDGSPLAPKFAERDILRRRLEQVEAEIVLHSQRQPVFGDLIRWVVVRHLEERKVRPRAIALASLAGGFVFACVLDMVLRMYWFRPAPLVTGIAASAGIAVVAVAARWFMRWSGNALLADGVIDEYLERRLVTLLTLREKIRGDLEEVQRQIAELQARGDEGAPRRDEKST